MKQEAEVDIEAIHKATRIGVFGSDEFMQVYAPEALKDEDVNRIVVDMCKSFDNVMQAVCEHYGITTEELRSGGKAAALVDARSILAYACRLIPGSTVRVRLVASSVNIMEPCLSWLNVLRTVCPCLRWQDRCFPNRPENRTSQPRPLSLQVVFLPAGYRTFPTLSLHSLYGCKIPYPAVSLRC